MVKILSIIPNSDYTISVTLDNGMSGLFNVAQFLDKGVFKELRDLNYFNRVQNFGRYIHWPNEQDFCADTIESLLIPSTI